MWRPTVTEMLIRRPGGHLASIYSLQAGRRAVNMLAFNKAARFLELALSTGRVDRSQVSHVRAELADVLANAGRGEDAAAQYLAACSKTRRGSSRS
jgi:uncharacterized protein HemY